METNQTEGLGRASRVKKLKEVFLEFSFHKRHSSGSASTNPYTLPSAPYSRRDALDSYRGSKKLKKKWTHSEHTVAVYNVF